jgi:hypothetical protein
MKSRRRSHAQHIHAHDYVQTEQMRKQYHFRRGPDGLDAWDVDRLIQLAARQPVEQVPLTAIREIDSEYWFDHGYRPTVRAVAEHCRLVNEADPTYPILLDPTGGVLDGMHRVARALLDGRHRIAARRLPALPDPDFRGCRPGDLPYDNPSPG